MNLDMNISGINSDTTHRRVKPKIAFIDDEMRILRSLRSQFRQTHDVFITTDPNELLQYIQQHDVEVVVSDQRMPQKLGVEVLKDVRQKSPNTIRILLTGYADLKAVVNSVNEGEIYRYITKPWQNEELKSVINKATEIAIQTKGINQEEVIADKKMNKQRLLVLDDDRQTYIKIKEHFKSTYHISWAANLEQAAELLGKHEIGVAISDVMLNGENITPVIYELKNIQPELMMIVLTDFQDANMIIDLINKGQIYRCLRRPTDFSTLGIAIDNGFEHHVLLTMQPGLQSRYEVEEVPEGEKFNFSERIKSFFVKFTKLRFWRN